MARGKESGFCIANLMRHKELDGVVMEGCRELREEENALQIELRNRGVDSKPLEGRVAALSEYAGIGKEGRVR